MNDLLPAQVLAEIDALREPVTPVNSAGTPPRP
jgi:hypothetical protein